MKILREDIEKLAELSRIELQEEEKENLQKEAERILVFFDELEKAKIEEVGAGSGDNVNEAVEDEKRIDRGTDRETRQFLEEEFGYLKVPKVFE